MDDTSHSPPESWVPKIKRRRRFSTEETKILEKEYYKNSSPNQEKIQGIANRISTPRKIVTTWFQNRRAKNKRKERTKEQVMKSGGDEEEEEYEEEERYETVSETNDLSSDYRLQSAELQSMDESMDLSLYTGALTASPIEDYYPTRPQLTIDTNHPYVFATQPSQCFTLPNTSTTTTTNQQYNINIYNNMNNYVSAPGHYDTRPSQNDNTIDMASQQAWLSYVYPQINRSFLNPTLPDPPQFYINPNDIYLLQPDKDH
ncbi:hypothetical protein HPULCUR_010443 [Helicostylum pulchrum]|uniref:Homeobox domain-containing protein n=1 Tax=Helicostylum pulchrum TaxID=562976 RepID=A0ABP9YDA1_9FUNG